SEAALIYVARLRNLLISSAMIVVQIIVSIALIYAIRDLTPEYRAMDLPAPGPGGFGNDPVSAAGVAIGLMVAVAFAAVMKARLLSRLLGARVSGWRWALVPASLAALAVGWIATMLPEWLELSLGVPLILAAYGAVVWYRGFGHEDRELFRLRKKDDEVPS